MRAEQGGRGTRPEAETAVSELRALGLHKPAAVPHDDPPNALDELKSTIGKKHQFGTTALRAYFTAD